MDIDAYGRYARQSALADFLEVAALVGRPLTEAYLARQIEKNGWASLPRRQFYTLSNIDEDPSAWSESVFAVIRERSSILGVHYPFDADEISVRLKTGISTTTQPYLVLLAISVLHAWSLKPSAGIEPDQVLEILVARALETRGLIVSRMGVSDRQDVGFVESVVAAGKTLGVEPTPNPLPRSRRVKDAGVDTLAGLTWVDGRPGGQWLFVGQATVGGSSTWARKLNEPEGPVWAGYMQEPLEPQAFLAVPHHVLYEHLETLTASKRGLILDRIRLAPHVGLPTEDERQLISDLCAVAVEA